MDLQETWQEMEKLLDEGKVKAIGISNFSVKKTKELLSYARHRPAANQVELHPYFRNSDISKYCQSEVSRFSNLVQLPRQTCIRRGNRCKA